VKLRDLSSGFRMYRRDVIAQMPIHARDFDVLEEILIRAYNDGWRIAEIPFHYMPRVSGKTHARLLKFGKAYLKTLFQMRRLRNAPDAADADYRGMAARRVRLLADLVGRGASVLVTGGGSTPIFEELPQAVVLESSTAKVRWLRLRHPRLVQCESTRLPFADASFEAAVDCGSGEKGAKEYAEALRILKPGGRFVLTARDAGAVTALGSAGFSEVKSRDFGRGATLVTARKPQT
jgi:SAM-dependent methyltransferase